MSILSILKSPKLILSSKLMTDTNRIRAIVESIDVNGLDTEFVEGLTAASELMTLAVGGPATWERELHYGTMPFGYLNPTWHKEMSSESRAEFFDQLFGDDYL